MVEHHRARPAPPRLLSLSLQLRREASATAEGCGEDYVSEYVYPLVNPKVVYFLVCINCLSRHVDEHLLFTPPQHSL